MFFYDDHRAKCYKYPKDLDGIKAWIYNNKQYAKEMYLMFRKETLVSIHSPVDQQIYRDLQISLYDLQAIN
tara:strand:+ start:662 stop:874 length:213 start_codon:yes stop_codon:yes gene_type:complete